MANSLPQARIAHSIGRVDTVPSAVPEECSAALSAVQAAIDDAHRGNVDNAQHQYKRALRDVIDQYGYGPVGDSNSVWGRQNRLTSKNSSNPAREDQLRITARALGAIVQNMPSDPSLDFAVFVPDIRRHLPFQHTVNAPQSDVVVAKHTEYDGELTHIEVGGTDAVRDAMSTVVQPEADYREANVARYPPDALPFIEQWLRDEALAYSLHAATVTRLPQVEWAPNLDADDYVACKEETGSFSGPTYRIHAIRNDRFACGASVDEVQEFRRLRPETVTQLSDKAVKRCGHQACQADFCR